MKINTNGNDNKCGGQNGNSDGNDVMVRDRVTRLRLNENFGGVRWITVVGGG